MIEKPRKVFLKLLGRHVGIGVASQFGDRFGDRAEIAVLTPLCIAGQNLRNGAEICGANFRIKRDRNVETCS